MKAVELLKTAASFPLVRFGARVGAFLAAGLPSFALAVPLNWVLVKKLMWHTAVAYALVLLFQVTLNFFMCRWFVFRKRSDRPLMLQLGQFMSGILMFRLADWAVYAILVEVVGVYFLAAQVANVLVFAVLKFHFSKRILEGASDV